MFRVRIRIASPSNPEVSRELEAVVDTGSNYTLIPRTVAEGLGIRVVRKMAARLANGVRIVRDMGEAELGIGELRTTTWVVFGETDDAVLLGAITLQELGLEVDPKNETLRPTEIYMFHVAAPANADAVPG
ncbi:MAG TPA: retroviral-like aspartic protease family protein [Thermoplasmata archaeon]|nr:retroviral-like aspartic protease family protein [Thermoplasmata archaeon]